MMKSVLWIIWDQICLMDEEISKEKGVVNPKVPPTQQSNCRRIAKQRNY